jgi:uncharacterized protein (DUF2384 family)
MGGFEGGFMAVLIPHVRAIENAHEYLGLSYQKIAEAIKADESTLHRWRSGGEPSPVFAARLEALEEFLDELKETFRRAHDAREWLETEVQALKGRRPIDLIGEGRLEVLTGLLYALNSGMAT